jgi:hypothetical protein
MNERTYRYVVRGTAADGQTWEIAGTVMMLPGHFPMVCDTALRESFMKLTRGEAVFGSPGLGCRGPYDITKLTVELILQ